MKVISCSQGKGSNLLGGGGGKSGNKYHRLQILKIFAAFLLVPSSEAKRYEHLINTTDSFYVSLIPRQSWGGREGGGRKVGRKE